MYITRSDANRHYQRLEVENIGERSEPKKLEFLLPFLSSSMSLRASYYAEVQLFFVKICPLFTLFSDFMGMVSS